MIQSQRATWLPASLLPSLKLEATGTHSTGTTSHLLLLNHQNGYFQNLGPADFQISEQMFVSGNMQNPETITATQLVPQPSPKTSQFPQLLQIFFLCKSLIWIHLLLYCLPNMQQVLSVEQFPPIDLILALPTKQGKDIVFRFIYRV